MGLPPRLLMVLLPLLCASCEQSRVGSLHSPDLSSSHLLSHLSGRTIHIELVDARPTEPKSREVPNRILETLRGANASVKWVEVSTPQPADLTVTLITTESTFSLGNWTGTITLGVRDGIDGNPPKAFRIEKVVTFSNEWGYRTADEALQKAFDRSMSELLAGL